ncbi:MAG TPA: hypothetical protein VGT98_07825 [Candidatus Elarobacter sp.]|nr:hypothetical protein [Candidatus Elarobacter sp.]
MREGERGELKRLTHEVRNALNGVAVNLEVARTRATRVTDASQLSPFLEAASQQLDAAVRLHKQFTDLAIALDAGDSPRSDEIATHR